MKKDIFLVDADDTLLDFHASSLAALKAAFQAAGVPWSEEYGEEFFTFNDSLWRKLERKEITRERLIRERFPAYLENLGLDEIPGEKFNQNYLAWLAKHPEYFPGAEEFLKKLAGAGRIYIVTNGTYAIQTSRFKISKLDQYADGVFVSEKIGCDKPGEAYTEYVTSHIPAFNRSAAVWIGDSLTADIRAANDAGIDSIWFNPYNRETEGKAFPDYEADSYEEILEILQIY